LENAALGIFKNGDLIAISSARTTIAAGASSGFSVSTQITLAPGDIVDARALVSSVGGVAPGLARRLGTLLGANATQVNSLTLTKCIASGNETATPPVAETYANLAALIADQANQIAGYIYFDGKFYYEYLGTTLGTVADYRRIFIPEYAAATVRENNTVLFDNDYIIGNASARSGNVLFDFTGAQLGAKTLMRHQDASAFTFPAQARRLFDAAIISTTAANYFEFKLVDATPGAEVVEVKYWLENGARVSPFKLAQEGATDGQALVWSAANQRFQPGTVSGGGGSNWTVVGSDIYRNSSVAIGRTTIPSGATFAVQSRSSIGSTQFFQLLNFSGTLISGLTQNAEFGVNIAPITGVTAVFRAQSNNTGSSALRILSLANTSLFEITGSTIRHNIETSFGNATPESGVSVGIRPISFNIAIRIYNTTGTRQMDIMGNNGNIQSLGGAFFGSANTGIAPTGRVDIRGIGTTTGLTLLLEDSTGVDNVQFIDNGQVRMLRLPTSSAGLAAGSLWNNGGVINIA
jgi:hypothetical protein